MVQFGSILITSPFSGELISNAGLDMGLNHSVRISSLELVLLGLDKSPPICVMGLD